jgi:phosphopantothenoylcysteine decarboxylase/phosphopantothenate--cysteine ligase
MTLAHKRIVLGVSGGIAAYKAVILLRELLTRGAEVRVVMTPNATRFIGAATFTGISGKPAVVDLWDPSYPGEVHVELGAWADAVVVAPATANVLARAASGMADDAVLATISCAQGPVIYAPAMHERMWSAAPTKRNVELLLRGGARFAGPVRGMLASGEIGWGRLAEPSEIADKVESVLRELSGQGRDLFGTTVLISAGPTVEDLDPVRYITNRSSGRMGFALAAAARDRGANVILVAGPTSIASPSGVERIDVRSARDMQVAIDAVLPRCDAVIMTAAIADYRAARQADSKIKKTGETLTIELVKNPDILATLGQKRIGRKPVLIGFAMETDDLLENARKKLVTKKVDLIVANEAAIGFGRDDTQAVLVSHAGEEPTPPTSKSDLAHRILDRVRSLLDESGRPGNAAAPAKKKAGKAAAKTRSRPAPRPRALKRAIRRKGRGSSRA